MIDKTRFQYCPKLVIFDHAAKSVLLARRQGEKDYNQVYSFIGGKVEVTDKTILEGIKREKNEEIGKRAIILAAPYLSYNVAFKKQDGSSMILPHIYSEYHGGEIQLNQQEYSDYQWVPTSELRTFEPKINTVLEAVGWALKLSAIINRDQLMKL